MDRIEIVRIISQLLRCAEWAIVACAEVCKLFEISAISGQPIDQVELRPSAESFSIGSNRVDLGSNWVETGGRGVPGAKNVPTLRHLRLDDPNRGPNWVKKRSEMRCDPRYRQRAAT